jgi:peptide/nickel transport system permease protein
VIRFVVKRLASMVFIILALTFVVFLLQKISHTNPVHAYLGPNASRQAIARESHILGYDKPFIVQYWHYVIGLLHGNLARSLRTRRSVATDLAEYLPATVELALAGLAMALALGALLGLASVGRWRASGFFRLIMISGASAPVFLLALLAILLFNGTLHWLPATGDTGSIAGTTTPTGMPVLDGLLHGSLSSAWDGVEHLILPAICVAVGPAVAIGRVLRTALSQAMESDFVRTARAKGQSEKRVLFRHALRNSLTAALSMTGLQIGLMFAGVVVVETIFTWPGIGLYTDESIPYADFPAIAGVTLVLGIGYVVINAVVDILQAVADPRIALD